MPKTTLTSNQFLGSNPLSGLRLAPMNFDMDDPRFTFNALVNQALASGVTPEQLNQGTDMMVASPQGNQITVRDLGHLGNFGQGAMSPEVFRQVGDENRSLTRQSRRDFHTQMILTALAAVGGAALGPGLSGGAQGAGGAGGTAAGSAGAASGVTGGQAIPGVVGTAAGAPAAAAPLTAGALTASGSAVPGLVAGGGAAGTAGGGSGLLSEIGLPEGVGRIPEGGDSGGFLQNLFGGGSVANGGGFLQNSGGALIGGGLGLLDSLMQPDEQTVTQRTELPPQVQEALDFLINESMSLQDTGSLVPGLSGVTQQGIEQLSAPPSGPGFGALSGFAGGQFSNPFLGAGNDLSGVTDAITHAANRAVGDRFTAAGRSGSPAEAQSVARTVSRELAPFAFGARENQMQRQFGAGESMLDRRLAAALPLMQRQRQQGFDTLAAGGLLDEQARREAMEPFQRLDLLTGPLVSAISGAPRSSSTTTPLFNSPLTSGLGGALLGSQLQGLFSRG